MLILTRKAGESIRVGDDVVVSVLDIKRNQIRIGIEAPRDIAVHREEIYQRIQNEKQGESTDEQQEIQLMVVGKNDVR